MSGDLGKVGVEGQTFEGTGQEAELLDVAEFPALRVGRAGVGARENLLADEFSLVSVVGAGGDGADVEIRNDKVIESFVKPAHRQTARGVEVIFE